MKPAHPLAAAALTLAATASLPAAAASSSGIPHSPNIIFILADDLGYGDLGVFFQNARRAAGDRSAPSHSTPQLDRMAAEGARLTHHYCPSPVSAPSRASFLSGLHQGHANVRDTQFDKALADNHTVATVLQRAGYSTAIIGKWGLHGEDRNRDAALPRTSDWPAHPLKRGFDYFYGFLRHVEGHEHYPKEQLYFAAKAKNRGPLVIWENHANVTAGLDKCYTTDLFTARAKQWIIDHKNTAPDKPFFVFLSYDTPHAVLELPAQAYPAGGGLTGGLQWLGAPGRMINTASGTPDSWTHPDYASATYDHDRNPATPEIPWTGVSKRHATSVRRIDDAVGDLLQTLRDLGIDQNTIVIFTSDNGPAQESYLPEPHTPEFFGGFASFDGIKSDTWEGGLRVPAIARWPGSIPAGGEYAAPCAAWDWLPTFADLAGLPPPANADGISLAPGLTGRGATAPRGHLYFEYRNKSRTPAYASFEPSRRGRVRGHMQAIRLGDLMAVRYDINGARDDFEIYDVVRDPKQTRDLGAAGAAHAGLQARLKALALQSRRPDPDAPRPYDNDLVPKVENPESPALAPGLAWRCHEGDFPWVPGRAAPRPASEGGTSEITGAFDLSSVIAAIVSPAGDNAKNTGGKNKCIVLTGLLRVPADGEYTFSHTGAAAAILRLHDATLIDADYGRAPDLVKTGVVRLQAGLHPFKLTCLASRESLPALKWSGPGFALRPLPMTAFAHETKAQQ